MGIGIKNTEGQTGSMLPQILSCHLTTNEYSETNKVPWTIRSTIPTLPQIMFPLQNYKKLVKKRKVGHTDSLFARFKSLGKQLTSCRQTKYFTQILKPYYGDVSEVSKLQKGLNIE